MSIEYVDGDGASSQRTIRPVAMSIRRCNADLRLVRAARRLPTFRADRVAPRRFLTVDSASQSSTLAGRVQLTRSRHRLNRRHLHAWQRHPASGEARQPYRYRSSCPRKRASRREHTKSAGLPDSRFTRGCDITSQRSRLIDPRAHRQHASWPFESLDYIYSPRRAGTGSRASPAPVAARPSAWTTSPRRGERSRRGSGQLAAHS